MNRTCELCATTGHAVRPGIAWYREGGVKTIIRCEDHAECQRRYEATGEVWPLLTSAEARLLYAGERWA